MATLKKKVSEAKAFVLHSISWSDNSLIVNVFSREYGLIAGVAKSAKRPYSVLRPINAHFQPLLVSWSGSGELKTITKVETNGFYCIPERALMSAWYLNELILRGVAKEDPHEKLFDCYEDALLGLVSDTDPRIVLRRFEWQWLCEIGYGLDSAEPDFYDLKKEPELRNELRLNISKALNRSTLNVRENLNHLSKLIDTRSHTEDT
ncbi:DNA repair protein RecO [Taylorella equigenitalis]|uniref:DNA repair protein RecO n=1 Tax=Taylorella equigenitalis TaxID=29575 RepID=UPI000407153B|nr:DNA repair protein RecO [Taylorella equigenitalis]ASY30248.1 DNA repair protein RecO [Taylorella equigenitalis]KOS58564.1 DNA polymerase [Taylorella equigenitalis]